MSSPILQSAKDKLHNNEDAVKKPACFFTAVDVNHFGMSVPFLKSLTKFHDPKDIDIILYTSMTSPQALQNLPKGIIIKDLTPYLEDQMFFYRQKPILMEELLREYELVIGMDSDQIVLDSLDPIIKDPDYDVGVVINANRFDLKFYPPVEIGRIGILPLAYYNCGLVAVTNKDFTHKWLVNCFAKEFDFMQYREQDVLNILTHFGNYNVRCFDMPQGKESDLDWWGIISKGELVRAEIENGKPIIPKGLGDQPYPPTKVNLRLIHYGGGEIQKNWASICSEPLIEYINEVIK